MTNKIIKMLNKYTIDSDTKREVLKGERKVRRRRMLAMSILAFVLTFVFISIGINHKVENRNLQDEVRDTELILEETNEEHEAPKQEIMQLNDDNYISSIVLVDLFKSNSIVLKFA